MTLLKWIVRLLLGLVLLLVLLIGGILLVEPQIDLTPYREQLSAQASELAGRKIEIGGDIRVDLGRHSRVALADVRIANPEWATTPALLRLGEAAAGIDLGALLSGVVRIEDVRLRDATAALEVSETGANNWTFATADAPPRPAAPDKKGRGPALIVDDVLVENVSLAYRAPAAAEPFDVHVERLQQRTDADMLTLDLTGRLQQLPVRVDGRVGPMAGLIAVQDIDVDLRSTLGETLLTLVGRLGDPGHLEDIELQSTLRSPDLAPVLALFGIEYRKDSDADLTLTITDLERGFAWQALGRLGPIDLDTQGELARPLALQDGQLTFDLSGDDLAAVGQMVGIEPLPVQPYRLAGQAQRTEQGLSLRDVLLETGETRATLSGELPLFPNIEQASTRLQVVIPQPQNYAGLLGAASASLGPVRIEATVEPQDDGGEVLDAQAELGEDRLTLRGPIGGMPTYRGTRLAFELAGPSIAALAAKAGTDGLPAKPYRVAGEIAIGDDDRLALKLADGTLGDLGIAAEGTLGRLPELVDADLSASAKGGSLNGAIGAITGTELPDLPFELAARVSGDLRSPTISDLQARLGDARLTSVGTVGLPPTFAGTDSKIELAIPDIDPLLPPLPPEAPRLSGSYEGSAQLRTENGMLMVRDARIRGNDLKFDLDAALPVSGELAGTRLQWNASGKNLAALLPAMDRYQPPSVAFDSTVDLSVRGQHLEISKYRVTLGDAEIQGDARLPLGREATGSQANLQLKGQRLTDLGRVEGVELPEGAFELKAALRQTTKGYTARDVAFRLGEGSGTASIDYEEGQPPYLGVDATLRDFDLRELLAEKAAASPTAAAPPASPDEQAATGGRLIPDTQPPLDALDALNGDFKIAARQLLLPYAAAKTGAVKSDIDLDAKLDGGNLTVGQLRLSGVLGEAELSGKLTRARQQVDTDWTLKATDYRIGLMLAEGDDLDAVPANDIDLNIAARGATWRQLAGSLNGSLQLAGGSGLTSKGGLDRFMGSFFDELMSTVNPFSKEETRTKIDCSAAALTIRDGVLLVEPGLVVRTDKIDISAAGTVDLNSENIDIRFKNAPRKGLGISVVGLVNPYVKVGGTLAQPGITLDAPKALLSGSAAVATGGLSILATAALDRVGTAAANPCKQVIDAAASGKAPTTLNPIDAIDDAIEVKPSARPAPEQPAQSSGIPPSD